MSRVQAASIPNFPFLPNKVMGTFFILNEELASLSKNQVNTLEPKKISNIPFHPPGIVEGSDEKVRKEETLLCDRLINDISKKTPAGSRLLQWYSWNNPVVSVLQGLKRPVCGLVALCMAGRMLQKIDPDITLYTDPELLEIARENGYTRQGEMFSAEEYAELARKVYNCDAQVMKSTLAESVVAVVKHLAQGLPVLVPYDTDRNYEPCLRKGHRAHWAILTGFVVGLRKQLKVSCESVNNIVKRIENPSVFTSSASLDSVKIDPSLVYVYTKQGKSARQQLWSLADLSASNANLIEADPSRDLALFKVPEEGIINTLCSKSVLLSPKS